MAVIRDLLVKIGVDANTRELQRFNHGLDQARQGAMKLAVAFSGVAVSMGFVLKKGGELEQTRISFETMLGSAENAKKMMADLSKFAMETPFEIGQLRDATKKLTAYKFAQEDIIPTMRTLGDITAGLGKDKMPLLIRALGQIKAKGVLKGQELMQLTESGLGITEALAKITGFSAKQLNDQTARLGINFETVMKAMEQIRKEKFFNLMKKQSDSFFGVLSNIKDIITFIAEQAGMDLINTSLGALVREVKDFLVVNKDLIKTRAVAFFGALGRIMSGMVRIVGGVGNALKIVAVTLGIITATTMLSGVRLLATGLWGAAVSAWGLVAPLFAASVPIVGLVVAAAALALIIEDIWLTLTDPEAETVLRSLINYLTNMFPNAMGVAKKAWDVLSHAIGSGVNFLIGLFKSIGGIITAIFTGDWGLFQRGVAQMQLTMNDIYKTFGKVLGAFSSAGQWIAGAFASGTPGSDVALKYSAPRRAAGATTNNNTQQNINIKVTGTANAAETAKAVRAEFQRQTMPLNMATGG
jgi:tape measure domain-containing protein